MKNKILIIGDYEAKGADSCKWDGNLYNLTDYDIVIIDTGCLYKIWSITSPGAYNLRQWSEVTQSIERNFKYIRKKIIESILIETQIFVLFNPTSTLSYWSGYAHSSLRTNDWLPISVETQFESGTTIILKNRTYQEYFKRLKSWKYYHVPKKSSGDSEVQEFYKPHNIKVQRKIIATNKLGKPLAMELVPSYDNTEQNSRIILLPATSEDPSDDIDTIISLTKSIDQTEAPDWVNSIEITNESTLKVELDAAEHQLMEKRDNYYNLVKHKSLLYDYSYPLQDICELTLKELGANIKPSVVTDEFIIEYNGKEALVEVKGKSKSVDKDDIGQLITDIGQHVAETGKPIKGLFIGNGWRNLPPHEREAGNKKTFPKEIVHIAETQNIGLLSSVDLLDAYCHWLDGKLTKERFLDTILTSSGIIRLTP